MKSQRSILLLLPLFFAVLAEGPFAPTWSQDIGQQDAATIDPQGTIATLAAPPALEPPSEGQALAGQAEIEGLLALGSADKAHRVAVDLLETLPADSPYRPNILRLQAWALMALGSPEALGALLLDVPQEAAELRYLLGKAQLLSEQPQKARQTLRRLWWRYPESIWGVAALRTLAETPGFFGNKPSNLAKEILPPAPTDHRRPIHSQRSLGQHLAKLQKALDRHGLGRTLLASELRRAQAEKFLRQEKFSEAGKIALKGIARVREDELKRAMRLTLAQAYRHRGMVSKATHYFDTVARGTDDELAHIALAEAGQMFIEHRRYADAKARFEKQLLNNPIGGARHDALWGLGWVAFRTGDFKNSRRFFDTLAQESPFGEHGAAASYWRARALEELGARAAAQKALSTVARRYPTDYYGYRAQHRLTQLSKTPKEILSHFAQGGGAAADAPPPNLPLHHAVRKVMGLHRSGLQHRVRRLLPEVLNKHRDALGPADVESLLVACAASGMEDAAKRLKDYRDLRFPDVSAPETMGPLARRYPSRFRRLLKDAGKEARVDPHLLMGLVRQESAYNPSAVSPAGAMGLMQVMPTTAKGLVRENRRHARFSSPMLLEPELNVQLGTLYLARMLRAFRGHEELALAAYNAGPGAVTRWRQARGELPAEIFVEEIPYRETRAYVKRVLGGSMAAKILEEAEALAQQEHASLR